LLLSTLIDAPPIAAVVEELESLFTRGNIFIDLQILS
jgi:hypothetical protein